MTDLSVGFFFCNDYIFLERWRVVRLKTGALQDVLTRYYILITVFSEC